MEFRELVSQVEANIDNTETCSKIFEEYLSAGQNDHAESSDSFEIAILLLCLGRYQDSFNILRNMDLCQTIILHRF